MRCRRLLGGLFRFRRCVERVSGASSLLWNWWWLEWRVYVRHGGYVVYIRPFDHCRHGGCYVPFHKLVLAVLLPHGLEIKVRSLQQRFQERQAPRMGYCCALTIIVIISRQGPARVSLSGWVAEGLDKAFRSREQGVGSSTGSFGAGDMQELGHGGSGGRGGGDGGEFLAAVGN